ncbi:condensation domain-containing protein, partial [Gordonia terrae]|uniref:condensation domain-containing protein n=1 Tax=Gordonia terrae TaxID=2055 RepID=UPI00200EC0F8
MGEIETVLAGADDVVAVAVVVRDDRLVAYVAGPEGSAVPRIREHAARRLASYMVPDTVVVLDALPLNTAGKVDRKALPAPDFVSAARVEPDTDTERAILAIVAEVLGRERDAPAISVVDSFFEIGGHSLSATRVAARIAHVFGVRFGVRELFDAPTVRTMAAYVDAMFVDRGGRRAGIVPVTDTTELGSVPRPTRPPLSTAQQRMWFINQFDPTSSAYNIPIALRVQGRLDVVALRAALADVMERHEVLRTRYPQGADGRPWQDVAPASEITVDQWWRNTGVDTLSAEPFDVTRDLPIRAGIADSVPTRDRPDDQVLVVVVHHIAADGESMVPLVDDLLQAYRSRVAGVAPVRAPLAVQYADVALWQQRALGSVDDPASELGRQARWWRSRLADLPEVLELPADRPRPPVASHRGAVVEFDLPDGLAPRIEQFARTHGVTVFMVLHASVAVVLARLSGTSDIAVASPVAGRGRAELDALIGMFVNTLVLRTSVDSAATFGEMVRLVRDTDLDAFAAADVPFEYLVEALAPTRSEAFAPLAQVLLTLEQTSVGELTAPGLTLTPVDAGPPAARFDLMIGMTADRDPDGALASLAGRIVYATDLFDARTAHRVAARIVDVLDAGLADPEVIVGDIDLVDEGERAAIEGWSRGVGVGLGWSGRSVGSVVAERVGLSVGD